MPDEPITEPCSEESKFAMSMHQGMVSQSEVVLMQAFTSSDRTIDFYDSVRDPSGS